MNGILKLEKGSNIDYVMPRGSMPIWITVKNNFSVQIHETDEGIVCDIYRKGGEMEESLSSCYAFDAEATTGA